MKDWGLSFQNKKSAKVFYQILKEGYASDEGSDGSRHSDELLGKRSDMWSDDEVQEQEVHEGIFLFQVFFIRFLTENKRIVMKVLEPDNARF
jgi:hypothetical protein